MIKKESCLLPTRKTRRTLSLAIFILLIFFSLVCREAAATTIDWQAQGPSPINQGQAKIDPDNPVVGALQSLLVDPTNSNTMYVGAVNGGIWKTTNGGSTWTPLTDTQNSLSMGGMSLDPGNPSRILAGFGVFSNFRGSGGPPEGVIFSSDAGATWTSLGGAITANTNVSSVLVKDQLMFVASRDNILNTGLPTPVTGLFRSTDGGASFIQVSGSGGLPTGSVTSLAFDPCNYNCVYAAVQKQGIFRSGDQGKTWTNITPANSGIGTTTQNVQLTVGAGGQSLFMGVANDLGKGSVQVQSVWSSANRGTTWQNMGGQGSGPGQGLPGTIEDQVFVGVTPGGQADINFALQADPKNQNYVYITGDAQAAWNELTKAARQWPNQIKANDYYGQLFRGDASKSLSSPPEVDPWDTTTPYNGQWLPITSNFAANRGDPHADSRSMAFDANGNLLETDDGGIYRLSNPQSSTGQWTSLNGNLQVTEIYGLSYDSNTHTVISGNQDTGSGEQNKVDGSPSLTWREIVQGDGAKTAVNDGDPTFSVHYMSYTQLENFARVKVDTDNKILDEVQDTDLRVVTGPGTTESLKEYDKAVGSSIPSYAPIRVNQADKTNLAIGTQRIYLATDDASNGLTQDLKLTDISTSNFASYVGDIAYGRPGNANLLLAAEGNHLWLSTTLLAGSLTQLTGYDGTNTIMSVCLNANSDQKFYAADGAAVRTTGDQSTTWTKRLSLSQLNALQFISNGLNAVVAGGYGTLYAARDTDLDNWYSLKGNLPNTFIWEMDYSSTDDTLAVGTLGRGAFTLANASTLMPATTPSSVDTDWIRLLRAGSDSQTLNGGTLQTPEAITFVKDLTLTALGGTFDTAGCDSTLSGVISGAGSFTKVSEGILSLRGANTYEGGTVLNAGTVNVMSDANIGAASGGLSFNGGTLQTAADFTSARAITLMPYGGTWDTNTFNSTLSGVISGPGTLSKISDGTLTLSGINTYLGGTLLNGGTLIVTHDHNLGAATGPLSFNGGALQAAAVLTTSRIMVVRDNGGIFNTGTFASTFNGPLFGYGTFTQQGTGSLTLGGDGSPFTGTYSLNSGTFTLNNNLGSSLSSCSLVVNAGSTWNGSGEVVGSLNLLGDGSGFRGTVVVPSDQTLTGNGPLGGAVNLQGDGSGYGGTYTVTNGTFDLGNTMGSAGTPATVVVNPGSNLTGTGPLVGSLTNRGNVNPGNSPGTLSIVGNYIQTATGTYTAEIASPSSYDRLNVTGAPGTATLAGAIAPSLYGGFRPRGNQVFPDVLTATGGVTGAFSTILNQQFTPTLFWQTRSNPTSVDLWVQRNYTNAGLSLNSNLRAVGTMLDGVAGVTSGDLDTVLNAIDYQPDSASVRDAYKQISPEKAGALTGLGFVAATFQMRNLATRTTNLRFVQGENSGGSGLTSGGLGFNYSKMDGLMLAYNGASISNLFSARKEFQAPESRWGLYLDGGAAFGSQNSSLNQTGYNFSLGGMTLGADYRLRNNLLVGLATGYSNTSSSFYGSGGGVNTNSVPFNAYAAYFPGPLYAYGSLGYALNLYDLNRGLTFGGLGRTASSSTTGNQFNLYGETGYDLKFSRFILTPSATLAYSALWVSGFTEQGAGALNLKVGDQSANSVQTGVGGRLTIPLKLGSVRVVPQGYAFYQHEFANGSRDLNASLSQGSSSFTFQTDAAQRNYALVGASVTAGLRKNLYAQVNYNAEVGRTGSTAQSINAGLRFEF